LVAIHLKKKSNPTICGEAGRGLKLGGIKRIRGTNLKKITKRERTVSRPYGGCLSAQAVKDKFNKIISKNSQKK